MRTISPFDKAIIVADNFVKTLFGGYQSHRKNPAENIKLSNLDIPELTPQQIKHSAGLMRINHCGEVCAQGLYQGQATTAKLPHVREKMQQAAEEENDHLAWCTQRLEELDSHTSLLNPFWYTGSFAIGAIAGLIGDKWSLGFVAETENQVVKHLDSHLNKLAEQDISSKAIIKEMRQDELEHAKSALEAGGAELPAPIKTMMGLMSKVMTSTVYYV